MNIKNITKYFACSALFLTMAACEDNEYSVIENGVYIAEAAPQDKFNQQIENLLVDDTDIDLKLNIRLAAPLEEEVKISVFADESLIKEYNAKNATTFELLPSQYMEMEQSVVIPAGETSAAPVTLTIKPFDTPNNESYAVPVRIKVESGAVSTVGSANKLLYLLKTPNKQKSVILNGREKQSQFKAAIPTDAWTFEYWIKVNNNTGRPTGSWEGESNKRFRSQIFGDNSAPIHLSCGNGEYLLLRYWSDGVKKIAPTLQCQMNGSYFDSSEFWWPDTWYHIAYTYDGETLSLYKDGELNNSLKVSKSFDFNKITFCSSFPYQMQVEFAQIRLWNQCLNGSMIKDGMSRQMPSDSEGLIGYWKCDEAEGNVIKDSSKNGNDIDFTGSTTVSWSEHTYNFSNPNKKK